MKLSTIGLVMCLLSLNACVSYADKQFNPTPEHQARMADDKARVDADERAERAEARRERREMLMDEADAIHRANEGTRPVYIIR